MIGIYKLTNPKGKIYIGQTTNFLKRMLIYKYKSCVNQPKLYNSLIRYGYENHEVIFLEECQIGELFEKERYWQDFYKSSGKNGLNCLTTKSTGKFGFHSEETKDKISQTKLIRNKEKGIIAKGEYKRSRNGKREVRKTNQRKYTEIRNKVILDFNTGIFYYRAIHAAESIGIKHATLRSYLSGNRYNKTNLAYV